MCGSTLSGIGGPFTRPEMGAERRRDDNESPAQQKRRQHSAKRGGQASHCGRHRTTLVTAAHIDGVGWVTSGLPPAFKRVAAAHA